MFGNRQLERYTGHPFERLLGMTDYDFAPKEDADRWRENDLKVMGGQRAEFEETGTDRNGRPYVLLSVKFPLSDESGTPVEVCGISTDITERKLAEEALRESMEQLERFNQRMVGRELRMVELKREVNDLSARLGQPTVYPSELLEELAALHNPQESEQQA